MVTYVNDLRLSELATGEGSGTWGTTTNTNLELIGEALGYGTEQSFSSDADATTTIGDGISDPARAMYFKVTSAGSLTATRTLTIAPNTVSRVMFIENATTGSQSIAISQGSGANVTIAAGKTAVVYLDGAGSGASVVDAMAGVDPGVTDTLAEVLTAGNTTGGTDIVMSAGDNITNASGDLTLDIAGDIILDAGGSEIRLSKAGTEFGKFATDIGTPSGFAISSSVLDGDIDFQGNDGGSTITALTLDMSEAGAATFNAGATFGSGIDVTGSVTADGLTVDGAATIDGGATDNTVLTLDSGTANTYLKIADSNSTNGVFIGAATNDLNFYPNNTLSAKFASNGTIYFYEDTGATPKLEWSASNERLTLTGSDYQFEIKQGANEAWYNRAVSDGSFRLHLNGTGDVLIADSSSNVGIGVDPSVARLQVKGAGATVSTNAIFAENSASAGLFAIRDNGDAFILGKTGIGTSTPDSPLEIQAATNSSSDTTYLKLYNAGENVGNIDFENGNGSLARITGTKEGAGSSANEGILTFSTAFDAVLSEKMRFTSAGLTVNELGNNYDFRVESNDNVYGLILDAGGNFVAIGNNAKSLVSGYADQHGVGIDIQTGEVQISSDAAPLQLGRTTTAGAEGDLLIFRTESNVRGGISNTSANDLRIRSGSSKLKLGESTDYVMIDTTASNARIELVDNSQSNPPTLIGNGPNFLIENGGVERVSIDGSGNIVFNESGTNSDFRVESDSNANMLVVDASADRLGIKNSGPTTTLDMTGVLRLGGTTEGDQGTQLNLYSDLSGNGYIAVYQLAIHTGANSSRTQSLLIDASGNVTIAGSLSKGSGSFKIDHPLPAKTDTHHLVHSFLEAPQADNVYRGKVDLVAGTASVNIDTVAGMTDGTFVLLNREVQCFTSNESGWTAVRGSVSGNTLTITAQDNTCVDTISWLVIGERQDQHMYDTEWTDSNGKVIVEPLKGE